MVFNSCYTILSERTQTVEQTILKKPPRIRNNTSSVIWQCHIQTRQLRTNFQKAPPPPGPPPSLTDQLSNFKEHSSSSLITNSRKELSIKSKNYIIIMIYSFYVMCRCIYTVNTIKSIDAEVYACSQNSLRRQLNCSF